MPRDPFNLPLQLPMLPYHTRAWNQEHADRHVALLNAARERFARGPNPTAPSAGPSTPRTPERPVRDTPESLLPWPLEFG